MSSRDQVITWLNDAYAMEQALEETLERHAKDAQGENEEVHERIQRHIQETRDQAATVRECIESLGGQVSGSKSAFASMFGAMQGNLNKPAGDTMVKNAVADYAAEHFEIATYRALIDAARQIGEEEVSGKLTGILRQEEEMARFLEQQLPGAVRETVGAAAS
ncbi:YciE/YciF ferroxidase family protein [Qaidamihabitans albus]|uniref:YciE/YciF ferroxidase family protein n=1 Tax=Qaidamihabitans albus TaxID=2795733 RepID=UPI0018F19433|nr:DUF892 family protein [Qaidamihabitans albus]